MRFDAMGEERDESDMLRFPPPPATLFPFPKPDDLDPFGVEGACLFEPEGEPGGGVPDLFALASRAAFWLFLPKGDNAAAEGLFEAGDGIPEMALKKMAQSPKRLQCGIVTQS